jgi:hypothetical protein
MKSADLFGIVLLVARPEALHHALVRTPGGSFGCSLSKIPNAHR